PNPQTYRVPIHFHPRPQPYPPTTTTAATSISSYFQRRTRRDSSAIFAMEHFATWPKKPDSTPWVLSGPRRRATLIKMDLPISFWAGTDAESSRLATDADLSN